MSFIKNNRIEHVYLTTFQGLDKARKLYENAGFNLTQEKMHPHWEQ